MRTVLVTGSDTGVGKTHATAALARLLAATGARVAVVKPVETGQPAERDAERARRLSSEAVKAETWHSFPDALAPSTAAARAGGSIVFDDIVARLRAKADCDWLLVEGAGGVATPIDGKRDWADLAASIEADAVIVVVADRLGAINQSRLALARTRDSGRPSGIWLNAVEIAEDPSVPESNREGLREAGMPVWAETGFESLQIDGGGELIDRLQSDREKRTRSGEQASSSEDPSSSGWSGRGESFLETRKRRGTLRSLKVTRQGDFLNLADNDYMDLAHDRSVLKALVESASEEGTSASASPLISGWRKPHADLLDRLCRWQGIPTGMLWTSGYAANSAVLGILPTRGDLVVADRLIHNSMIAGILRSGARLKRYDHLDLGELERMLKSSEARERSVFVVTESVFSMDGDTPDLGKIAQLRREHGFCWVLDEAHAFGWYGPEGAGLAREQGVTSDVDVYVGTLGKALASAGAFTLFQRESVRDYMTNAAGEFIYSTGMPPGNAAAAAAAIERIRELVGDQSDWRAASRRFRAALQAQGWRAPDGDSPIIPVRLDDPESAVRLAAFLRDRKILVGAVRPPTVPEGTSRLRISLKRTFRDEDAEMLLAAMDAWRKAS